MNFSTNAARPAESESISRGRQGGKSRQIRNASSIGGDVSIFGPGNSFTRQDVESCYTPIEWGTLSPWEKCRFFWDRLAVSDVREVNQLAPMDAMAAPPNPNLLNYWIASIIAHPLAYAMHRLAHFSSEIIFPLGQTTTTWWHLAHQWAKKPSHRFSSCGKNYHTSCSTTC